MRMPPRLLLCGFLLGLGACASTQPLSSEWSEDAPPEVVHISWEARLGVRHSFLQVDRNHDHILLRETQEGRSQVREQNYDSVFQGFWGSLIQERRQTPAQRGRKIICQAPYRVRIEAQGRIEQWSGCRNPANSNAISAIERHAERFLASDRPEHSKKD